MCCGCATTVLVSNMPPSPPLSSAPYFIASKLSLDERAVCARIPHTTLWHKNHAHQCVNTHTTRTIYAKNTHKRKRKKKKKLTLKMCFIILGPSRKTFIFIKSRVGQFGKLLFDMSVLFTGCCFCGNLPRCPEVYV